jgi:hypothetical protein
LRKSYHAFGSKTQNWIYSTLLCSKNQRAMHNPSKIVTVC